MFKAWYWVMQYSFNPYRHFPLKISSLPYNADAVASDGLRELPEVLLLVK